MSRPYPPDPPLLEQLGEHVIHVLNLVARVVVIQKQQLKDTEAIRERLEHVLGYIRTAGRGTKGGA